MSGDAVADGAEGTEAEHAAVKVPTSGGQDMAKHCHMAGCKTYVITQGFPW